jgi:hypothetical protein
VCLAVDLAIKDLFGTRNSNGRNLAAQLFAGLVGFLLDLRLGCGKLAFTLLDAGLFAIGNDFVRARMSLVKNAGCLMACFIDDLVSLRLRFKQFLLALVSSSETFLIGGQMNFMQNQTNTIMAIVWPMRVILIST